MPKNNLTEVLLLEVVFDADLRCSDATLFARWGRGRKLPPRRAQREAVCFVNSARTLMRVVLLPRAEARGLTSLSHRYLRGMVFSGLTLQDVAHDLGLHVRGMKLFSEHFPQAEKYVRKVA